jgi:hypothetical protein
MKLDVYDYRKMENGRAAHSLIDIPEDMEDRLNTWVRNGWVMGLLPEDEAHPPGIGVVDFLSDIVLWRLKAEGGIAGADLLAYARALFAIDPPELTRRYRSSIEGKSESAEES